MAIRRFCCLSFRIDLKLTPSLGCRQWRHPPHPVTPCPAPRIGRREEAWITIQNPKSNESHVGFGLTCLCEKIPCSSTSSALKVVLPERVFNSHGPMLRQSRFTGRRRGRIKVATFQREQFRRSSSVLLGKDSLLFCPHPTRCSKTNPI